MTQFIIYGKANCPWCDRAKALLDMKGLTYSYRDISVSAHWSDMKEQFPDTKTVPQVFDLENMFRVGGYDQLRDYLS